MITKIQTRQRASLSVNRERARIMRHKSVALEKLFWAEVRNRKLAGYKFKRQVLIGPYIVDFVCLEQKLVVELDGPFHAARQSYDAQRDAFLRLEGFRVLRLPNSFTAEDLGVVLLTVKNALETDSPSP